LTIDIKGVVMWRDK